MKEAKRSFFNFLFTAVMFEQFRVCLRFLLPVCALSTLVRSSSNGLACKYNFSSEWNIADKIHISRNMRKVSLRAFIRLKRCCEDFFSCYAMLTFKVNLSYEFLIEYGEWDIFKQSWRRKFEVVNKEIWILRLTLSDANLKIDLLKFKVAKTRMARRACKDKIQVAIS